jgi:hypothetical protein
MCSPPFQEENMYGKRRGRDEPPGASKRQHQKNKLLATDAKSPNKFQFPFEKIMQRSWTTLVLIIGVVLNVSFEARVN